jgi:hypothetical protein
MSALYGRRLEVANTRISVVTDAAASLNAQVRELELLRDQVKKAQLSAQKIAADKSSKRISI